MMDKSISKIEDVTYIIDKLIPWGDVPSDSNDDSGVDGDQAMKRHHVVNTIGVASYSDKPNDRFLMSDMWVVEEDRGEPQVRVFIKPLFSARHISMPLLNVSPGSDGIAMLDVQYGDDEKSLMVRKLEVEDGDWAFGQSFDSIDQLIEKALEVEDI